MILHNDIQNISYLKSKNSKYVPYKSSADIFWPFYLWRVIAPKEKAPINIFQMLLLKLIRAGCHATDKLCVYSNLDNELVKYILAQLTNEGYIEGWKVTEKSLSLLENKDTEVKESSSYYLMQDATSGQLIPRVLSTLPYIDNIDLSSKFPQFIESRSSGKLIKPLLVKNTIHAQAPTAEQMNMCIRAHRRAMSQLKQADLYVPDIDSKIDYSVEFIEESPISVFVYVKLFSTQSGERSWYMSDPSGLTATLTELNESAEKMIHVNKVFASRVSSAMGIAEQESTSSYSEQLRHFEEQAKMEMLAQYSQIKQFPLIQKHLLAMLRIKKQVEHDSSPRFELLDSLLSELQRVLEAWLKTIIEPSEANNEWKILVVEWDGKWPKYQMNKNLRKQIYLRTNGVSDEVAYQLGTVNPGNIRGALTFGNQSLKPLVCGLLLKHPHVIEAINAEFPTWLDLIIPLAEDRNKFASHAGGQTIEKESVMHHLTSVETLLTVLEKFLGSK
jgi:hypothetical protein